VIDPDLVYLAAGYGGVVSGDEDTLYRGLWQGFRNTQVPLHHNTWYLYITIPAPPLGAALLLLTESCILLLFVASQILTYQCGMHLELCCINFA